MTSTSLIRSLLFATIVAAFAIAGPQNATYSRDAEAALVAANDAYRKGDLETALREYRNITERFVDTNAAAKALVNMGRLYEDLKLDSDAQKAYERAISRFGRTDSAITAQARLDALKGEKAEARDIINGPVWSGTSGTQWKAISPDGQFLISDLLLTRNVRTGREGYIGDGISNQSIVGGSVLSTDGTEIAFIALRNPISLEIRAVPLNATKGAKARTLFSALSRLDFKIIELFGWSPQPGTAFLLRTENDQSYRIVEVPAGGRTIRTIVSLEMWQRPANPNLSPDARYIAFDAQLSPDSYRRGIFVLSVDGGNAVLIPGAGAENTNPVWTPDGNGIVFASNQPGSLGLQLVAVSGGRISGVTKPLKTTGGRIRPVGFARDGSLLYSTQTTKIQVIHTAEIDLEAGAVKEPVRRNSDRSRNNFSLAYSPDGNRLAYFSQGTSNANNGQTAGTYFWIEIQPLVSGGDQQTETIRTTFVEASGLSWFDNQSFVFAGRLPGESPASARLRRLTLDGRESLEEHVSASPSSPTRVSHGGIYYLANGTGESGSQPNRKVMVYTPESRRESIRLFEGPIVGNSLTLSPDGQRAAVMVVENPASPRRAIAVISTSGGLLKKLTPPETQLPHFDLVDWSSDGNNLLVRDSGGMLWRIPTDGGKPSRIGTAPFPIAEAIRPDRKQVAYVSDDTQQEVQLWLDRDLLRSSRSGTDIFLAQSEGNGAHIRGPVTRLAENHIFSNQAPVWSPNGELIAFKRWWQESEAINFPEIVVRNLKTREEKTFIGGPGGRRPPIWFHDNQSLLQGGNLEKEGYLLRWNFVLQQREEVVRGPALLTTDNGLVAISPDDRTLYISIKERAADSIIVWDLAAKRERARIHLGVNVKARVMALSPDGRTFAVIAGDPPQNSRIFRIGVDGKDYHLLYTGDGLLNNIVWTQDGHSVLVGRSLGRDSINTSQIVRIPWDGGSPQPTGLEVKDLQYFGLSSDGAHIAFDGSGSWGIVRTGSTR